MMLGSSPSGCLWVCIVTGACPSSASPSTWRSPARRLRPCLWAEGWPVPCPRSRSRWSRTMTRTSTTTGPGTWAVRPHYKAETWCLDDRKTTTLCGQTTECSQCWPRTVRGGTEWQLCAYWHLTRLRQSMPLEKFCTETGAFLTDFVLNSIL